MFLPRRRSRANIASRAVHLRACLFTAVIARADDKSANDAKNLQGTWQAVDLEANGEKRADDQVKELQIVFKGDEVFAVKPEGEGRKVKFTPVRNGWIADGGWLII